MAPLYHCRLNPSRTNRVENARGTRAEETPGVSAHAHPGAPREHKTLFSPRLLKVDLTGWCKQWRPGQLAVYYYSCSSSSLLVVASRH
ncbi:unnamed protein product [Arctogadus glacialis]